MSPTTPTPATSNPNSPAPHAVAARLALARDAAAEAGRNAMRLYQSPAMAAVAKSDGSPVTSADKEGEEIIRRAITGAARRSPRAARAASAAVRVRT